MMNKVLLIGRLARDPELKEFSNGGALANLRVMTNRAWRDKNSGEMREKAQGHTVVVHSETVARRLVGVLKKGHMVYVEGMLETRQWQDGDNKTRYATEVVVRPFLGTVRKVPGMSGAAAQPSQAHTTPPAIESPAAPDQYSEAHEAVNPEAPASPIPDHVEIDFFADEGLGDEGNFDF